MMKHLIFYLNLLADAKRIQESYQEGLVKLLEGAYGKSNWDEAYQQILADWDSYHQDLNFAGDEGMADMREARFRLMRAMFRLTGVPEPSQTAIHDLADKAVLEAALAGNAFFEEIPELLQKLHRNYHVTVLSYFPQAQLEAMVKAGQLEDLIFLCVGADSFERYTMDEAYFQSLLLRLNANPQDCLLIDKQALVLEVAQNLAINIFPIVEASHPAQWTQSLISISE